MRTRIRSWIAHYGPRRLNISGALIQLYVHDDERTTTFTFTNFPSLYAPEGAQRYRYLIECRGPDGARLGRRALTVPVFGAKGVGISELFGPELPPWGTIHVGLRPTSWLSQRDRHLGRLTPYFYALYHEREMRSLALIHPQTGVSKVAVDQPEWHSSLLVDVELADVLEVFQMNPTPQPIASELRVHDEHGDVLAKSPAELPPFGVRRERWLVNELGASRWVSLSADRLAAPNAKPLVFMTSKAGLLSGSHS